MSASADYAKAVSTLSGLNVRDYLDWNTSPLGKVVKERLTGKVALVTGNTTPHNTTQTATRQR